MLISERSYKTRDAYFQSGELMIVAVAGPKGAAEFCHYNALFFALGKLMVFKDLCVG